MITNNIDVFIFSLIVSLREIKWKIISNSIEKVEEKIFSENLLNIFISAINKNKIIEQKLIDLIKLRIKNYMYFIEESYSKFYQNIDKKSVKLEDLITILDSTIVHFEQYIEEKVDNESVQNIYRDYINSIFEYCNELFELEQRLKSDDIRPEQTYSEIHRNIVNNINELFLK